MSDTPPVRYRNTVLYDRGGQRTVGDVLLHADGHSSPSVSYTHLTLPTKA